MFAHERVEFSSEWSLMYGAHLKKTGRVGEGGIKKTFSEVLEKAEYLGRVRKTGKTNQGR